MPNNRRWQWRPVKSNRVLSSADPSLLLRELLLLLLLECVVTGGRGAPKPRSMDARFTGLEFKRNDVKVHPPIFHIPRAYTVPYPPLSVNIVCVRSEGDGCVE